MKDKALYLGKMKKKKKRKKNIPSEFEWQH